MNRTIIEQAFALAENQQGIATEAITGLHKIQTLCIDANSRCRSVNDWENAVRNMYNAVMLHLSNIEGLMGSIDKTQIDHTDRQNDLLVQQELS
jgi:uncharacterized protein YoxC